MEKYRVVDDKTLNVLLETTENPWGFVYEQIKKHPEYDVYIEVYDENGKFDHWVDPESIVTDYEYWMNGGLTK